MLKHSAPISGVATLDNKLVATCGYDSKVILWDLIDGLPRPLSKASHDHLVNSCDFSADGTLLATASSDYSIRIWSVPDMRLLTIINTHKDDVLDVAFSHNGLFIAACSYDGTLSIHKLDGKKQCLMHGHKGLVESFAWSIDDNSITSVGTDGTIRTWCTKSGMQVEIRDDSNIDVDTIAYLPNGNKLFGDNNGMITSISDNQKLSFKAHDSAIKNIVINQSYTKFVSTSYDGTLAYWALSTDFSIKLIFRTKLPKIVWPRAAAFLNENTIVFGTFGSCFLMLNLDTETWSEQDITPSLSLNSVHISGADKYTTGDAGVIFKNGNEIANVQSLCNMVVNFNGYIYAGGQACQIFNISQPNDLHFTDSPINCATVVNDTLAIGTYSGKMYIFKNKDDGKLTKINEVQVHENAIKGISFNGEYVFSGCADGELCILNANDFKIEKRIQHAHDGILNGCAPFNNGFATISRDLHLGLWSIDGLINKVPSRHKNSIKCIASNNTGNYIATGSYTGFVDIFDVEKSCWINDIKRLTSWGISSLDWSELDQTFYASSYDGNLYKVEF